MANEALEQNDQAVAWQPGQLATQRRFLPNVPVVTQDGERHLFYDDLVKDRTVIIHFFSLAYHPNYPVTRNLVAVQRLLKHRLGTGVFMYSITTDPQHDDVQRIAEFARRHHAQTGWQFLTGESDAIDAIKRILFFHTHEQAAHEQDDAPDCSMGLLRYGNDQAGLWGSVPAKTDAQQIVDRLSWLEPRQRPTVGLKRRGPRLIIR